ncbi:lambda exonuclease family protein [Mesoterricola sediminis]|uniref:YqaJ viral recombinase domain-containing protein n=1 Tax=Mesoterricola sediminis TaxID=2927980 RepID=A0AA48GV85_9BACT|nr:lambda exonuclease family protein [Mesoterricola sediminis]BDU76255.1 hypothetical protein METESE_12130 [Mesoterricola sediminis]
MKPFIERIINVEQGSDEWKKARAGRVTASRISDILAKGKNGAEPACRRDYKMQLACEILTGVPQEDTFYSKDMQWGNEQEPYARAAYAAAEGVLVDVVGMTIHPKSDRCAASPDGLVDWDGKSSPKRIVQFKCPKTATHIGYIEAGVVPSDYRPQMYWELACTGAEVNDFASFDPRLPENIQLFIVPLPRDEQEIQRIEREVDVFLDEVDILVAKLRKLGQEEPQEGSAA